MIDQEAREACSECGVTVVEAEECLTCGAPLCGMCGPRCGQHRLVRMEVSLWAEAMRFTALPAPQLEVVR